MSASMEEFAPKSSPRPHWETVHTDLLLHNHGPGDATSVTVTARFPHRSTGAPRMELVTDPVYPSQFIKAGTHQRLGCYAAIELPTGWESSELDYPIELEISWHDGARDMPTTRTITVEAPDRDTGPTPVEGWLMR